jgi:uroporphyrin-3 C-methyltransferase
MDNKNEIIEETGDIIDVEPESPDNEPQQPETEKKPGSTANPALLLSIVSIVIILILGVVAYRYWTGMANDLVTIQQRIDATLAEQQRLVSEMKGAQSALKEHQQKIEEQQAQAKSQADILSAEKATITEQANAMQQSVAELNEKVGRTDSQWQVAEAEYLMRLANHRLALANDVPTALTALQQADEKLLSSGDLGLLRIREKLGQEITALKSVSVPDIAGIAATLQALAVQVPALKLGGTTLDRVEPGEGSSSEKSGERNLDTLLEDSWRGFRELVVIRKHDKPVSAMLPPSEQFFLYQNLQLQLESARLSLLRQENILYKSSLETAIEWVNAFFDAEDAQTIKLLANLRDLANKPLQAEMPAIAGSLNLLIEYRGHNK